MAVSIDLKGAQEVIDKLEQMGRAGNMAINEALTEGAEPILVEMQKTTLFSDRSGKLRKSMKISKVKSRLGRKYIWIGDVDREALYGWVVEFGSARSVARPFMRNAWSKKREEALNRIRGKMKERLNNLE